MSKFASGKNSFAISDRSGSGIGTKTCVKSGPGRLWEEMSLNPNSLNLDRFRKLLTRKL